MILGSIFHGGRQYFVVLEQIPLYYFLPAVSIYYLSILLYVLRWKLILDGIGKKVSLQDLLKIFMASIFVNNITPTSRSGGEILRITWVSKKAGIPLGVSAASVIYERLLEAIPFLFLVLFAGMYTVPARLPFFIIILFVVWAVWAKWDLFVRLFLRATKTKIDEVGMGELSKLRNSTLVTGLGIVLSTLVWILDVARFKLITMAFGLSLPWKLIVVISVVNMILGLISITPGGIGIMEGGLIGTLVHFGIPQIFAISITLLERFISYVLSTLVGMGVLLLSGGLEVWKALKSR